MNVSTELSVDREYFNEKVTELLINRFRGDSSEKTNTKQNHSDLQFACPYCGDSHKDVYAKRGHIYYNTLKYVCYNCGAGGNFEELCKDFDVSIDIENKLKIIGYLDTIKSNIQDYRTEFSESSLKDIIDLNDFIKRANSGDTDFPIMNIMPIKEGSVQDIYLKNRKIISEKQRRCIYQGTMYYTSTFSEPVILILNRNKENLLGLQMRNLKDGVRRNFKVYSYENILSYLYPEKLEELAASKIHLYNKLSYLYNILNIKFDGEVTVFEGFLDSIFYPNSIGAIGTNSDIDFLIRSGMDLKFFYDNDDAGNKLSLERLEQGYKVFLWNKLFEAIIKMKKPQDVAQYEYRIKKIKDLNKLNELVDNPYELFNIPSHFSKDRFDKKYIPYVKKNIYKKAGYNNKNAKSNTNTGIQSNRFRTN